MDTRNLSFETLVKSLKLSDEFLSRVKDCQLEEVKKERIVSLYLKDKYVKEYSTDISGKPISKNCFFNISHSQGVVALAKTQYCDIGVDIEVIRDYKDDLAQYICTDDEYKYIRNKTSFFEIWTSKESLVKCNGLGIRKRMVDIPALPVNGKKEFEGSTYSSKIIKIDDMVISITIQGKEDFEIKIL